MNSFSCGDMPSANLFTIHYHLFPNLVGLTGIEPVTSSLSGTRSNQLSYKPMSPGRGAEHSISMLVRFNIPPKGFSLERR